MQLTLNQRAVGSSPTAPTKVFNDLEIYISSIFGPSNHIAISRNGFAAARGRTFGARLDLATVGRFVDWIPARTFPESEFQRAPPIENLGCAGAIYTATLPSEPRGWGVVDRSCFVHG
jgi:hypothetical protein